VATGVEWEIPRTSLDIEDESIYITTIGTDSITKVEFVYWYTPVLPTDVDNSGLARIIGGILAASVALIALIKFFDWLWKYYKDKARNKEDDINYRKKLGINYDADRLKLRTLDPQCCGGACMNCLGGTMCTCFTQCFKRRNVLLN
jgi:hypothetical protein